MEAKAQDYAFLTTMVGGLAHELRNPLSTINLNLQLLKEDWQNAESTREKKTLKKIEVIHAETHRLQEILDDFLRFVRIDNLALEPRDVNALLDEIVSFMETENRASGIDVIRFHDYNLPRCPIDANFMKQALLNILLNARQAIEKDGQIMVRTSREGDWLKIEITDTGPGMSPEVLAQIFKPYFSTKERGTGLGLPTTRRIIEEHHGTIDVRSERNRGTSVTVRLPLAPAPAPTEGKQ